MEPPALRPEVAALRTPAGWLFQDARRWELFYAGLRLEGAALDTWLEKRGLGPRDELPPVRWRSRQHFGAPLKWLPSSELHAPAGARFSCAACASSCRGLQLGPLTLGDIGLLVKLPWEEGRHPHGELFIDAWGEPLSVEQARAGDRDVYLRKGGGAGCRFLQEDGLCSVHARFGVENKPVMCRLFPFSFLATPGGVLVQARFSECASIERAIDGEPVAAQLPELAGLLRSSDTVRLAPPLLWLAPGRLVGFGELEALSARLLAQAPASPAEATAPPGLASTCWEEVRAWAERPRAAPVDRAPIERLVEGALDDTAAGHGASAAHAARRIPLPLAAPLLPGAPAARLDAAALALEERLIRAELWSLELLDAADLITGAALLLTRAAVGRRVAARLAALRGLPAIGPRELVDGQVPLRRKHLEEVAPGVPAEAFAEALLR